jgi:hypothetical protein
MLRLVLHEVHRLDDVDVVECRADAELGGQLFDVVLLRLVLPPLAELLDAGKAKGQTVSTRRRERRRARTLTA